MWVVLQNHQGWTFVLVMTVVPLCAAAGSSICLLRARVLLARRDRDLGAFGQVAFRPRPRLYTGPDRSYHIRLLSEASPSMASVADLSAAREATLEGPSVRRATRPKFTLTFRAITTAACSFVANYRWGTDYT
jgi:hypothetical protein